MAIPTGKLAGPASSSNPSAGQIGLVAAVSIGIGGMVGAGIFSILGVVAQAAGNMMWLAFLIGGVVALLSTYSYAKLGAVFPSAGRCTGGCESTAAFESAGVPKSHPVTTQINSAHAPTGTSRCQTPVIAAVADENCGRAISGRHSFGDRA